MKKLLYSLLSIPLIFGGFLGFNYYSGNVHVVAPGKIIRTGQLDEKQLSRYTQQYHIKTLINLRGAWPGNGWYQVESQFVATQRIHYRTFRFSSYDLPTKSQLRALVNALLAYPKPLMFHCEGGADRTGMASAISLILFNPTATEAQIRKQASWRYNAISNRSVGYQVMRNYFAWLKAHHLSSSRDNFLIWLNSPEPMKPYRGWFL